MMKVLSFNKMNNLIFFSDLGKFFQKMIVGETISLLIIIWP